MPVWLLTYVFLTEKTKMLSRIGVTIAVLAVSAMVLVWLWEKVRFRIAKWFPERSALVEVIRVTPPSRNRSEGTPGGIAVCFLDKKRMIKRRQIYMDIRGIQEGDVGILSYQLVLGLAFKKVDSRVEDRMERYYRFGFAKAKKEAEKEKAEKQKNRKRRKYW